jgi:hypothetical protein
MRQKVENHCHCGSEYIKNLSHFEVGQKGGGLYRVVRVDFLQNWDF